VPPCPRQGEGASSVVANVARGLCAKDGLVEDMLVKLTGKSVRLGLVLAGLCLGLAACGVRGSLDPPPEAKTTAASPGTQPGSAAPPKPHDGFLLDPLLR
jgi:predicted small lipoprotein YifL